MKVSRPLSRAENMSTSKTFTFFIRKKKEKLVIKFLFSVNHLLKAAP